LFYWNDYYNCVRRFVVSDPELPDSLYLRLKKIFMTFLLLQITVNYLVIPTMTMITAPSMIPA